MADPMDSFNAFEREVYNMRNSWELWRLLNGEFFEEPKWQIVFNALPAFHWHTSHSLLTLVVLGLNRLADAATDSQGRENLTLERIMDETDFSIYMNSQGLAKKAMDDALAIILSDEFRTVRNKVLAHNDLNTIIVKKAPLDIEVINRAVYCVATFHERTMAVRKGTGINHATGEGSFPDLGVVAGVQLEISKLAYLLDRGSAAIEKLKGMGYRVT